MKELSDYEIGVNDGKRGLGDMLIDKDRAMQKILKDAGLGTIKLLCEQLAEAFAKGVSFQAVVKVHKAQWTDEWRYDVVFSGSFSRKDLNVIDEIARSVDCYYELVGGTVNFSLTIPYKESL